MENASKAFDKEHHEDLLILAISAWVVHGEALFWKILWLRSNQISDNKAF